MKKERLRNSDFRAREFWLERQKWKWSHELKGPLKIPRNDPLAGFRVKDFVMNPEKPVWEKLEHLYVDDEPLEGDQDDEEYQELIEGMESRSLYEERVRSDLIDDRDEVKQVNLRTLAHGRKSAQ